MIKPRIRFATHADMKFISNLQRKWSNEVGFLPWSAHRRYIDAQCVLIATINGQPAGFCNMIISLKGLLRLPQIAISHEVLRQGIGSRLMQSLNKIAAEHGCAAIRLTTREDLAANEFWPTTGFYVSLTTYPANARRQPLIEWTHQLR